MAATQLFTDHPHSVGETYGEHARFALRFAGQLALAAGAAAVHAVCPALFDHSASARVRKLHAQLCDDPARGETYLSRVA
ncbi:MAG: DUF6356 family protein [Acidimicrobiia bacterium]|nr:DUF6356 family protein [Acidimicrobiia bacterium]